MKTLFNQLSKDEIECLALVIGLKDESNFTDVLKEIPEFDFDFQLGHVIRAYYEYKLSKLDKFQLPELNLLERV